MAEAQGCSPQAPYRPPRSSSATKKAAAALWVSRSWQGHEPDQRPSGNEWEARPLKTILEVEQLTYKSN